MTAAVGPMRNVFMFSGQGSQYYQMGRALFDSHAVYRRVLHEQDEIVRGLGGMPVLRAIYDPQAPLSRPMENTALSHPAIVMVEYALARALMHEGVQPDLVLGASLGTFTAAVVAGALSIEDALRATLAHAAALEQQCLPGGMVAVLDRPALLAEPFLRDQCELAALNFDSHFVVSAPAAACTRIEAELARRDITHQRIVVSYAFHSRWIDAARPAFEAAIGAMRSQGMRLPLWCCEAAAPLTRLQGEQFWRVTRMPIRFPAAIQALEREGPLRYLDLGPAGTLATFLKYLLPPASQSIAQPLLTPYGHDLRHWAQVVGR